jgi:hypothetical protein
MVLPLAASFYMAVTVRADLDPALEEVVVEFMPVHQSSTIVWAYTRFVCRYDFASGKHRSF